MKKETILIYNIVSAFLVILSALGIFDILHIFNVGYEKIGETHVLAGAVLAFIIFHYIVTLHDFLKEIKKQLAEFDKERTKD